MDHKGFINGGINIHGSDGTEQIVVLTRKSFMDLVLREVVECVSLTILLSSARFSACALFCLVKASLSALEITLRAAAMDIFDVVVWDARPARTLALFPGAVMGLCVVFDGMRAMSGAIKT